MDQDLISPASILKMLRLFLFVHILSKGHFDIMSAVCLARNRERSYISALKVDFKFLADLGGVAEELKQKSVADWTSHISRYPRHFLTQSCRSLSSEGAILRDAPPSKSTTPTQENTSHACDCCPKIFKTYQQLQLHKFRVHQCVQPLHMAVHDTHCPI